MTSLHPVYLTRFKPSVSGHKSQLWYVVTRLDCPFEIISTLPCSSVQVSESDRHLCECLHPGII